MENIKNINENELKLAKKKGVKIKMQEIGFKELYEIAKGKINPSVL